MKRTIRFRFYIFSTVIIAALLILVYALIEGIDVTQALSRLPNSVTLSYDDEAELIAAETGFYLVDKQLSVYDKHGKPIEYDTSELPQSFNSAIGTSSCLLLDETLLYAFQDMRLSRVFSTSKYKIKQIYALSSSLLMMTESSQGLIGFLYFKDNTATPIPLDSELIPLCASVDSVTDEFSLLCVQDSGPYLSSVVLNLSEDHEIGRIILDDIVYYDMLRFKQALILVGTDHIACYNIENGIKLWNYSFVSPTKIGYAQNEDSAIVFADSPVFEGYSVMLLDPLASPTLIKYLQPIDSVQACGSGFAVASVELLNYIASTGEIKTLRILEEPIAKMAYNANSKILFMLSQQKALTRLRIK